MKPLLYAVMKASCQDRHKEDEGTLHCGGVDTVVHAI